VPSTTSTAAPGRHALLAIFGKLEKSDLTPAPSTGGLVKELKKEEEKP
jgi:hypothetical protein